MLFFLRYVCIMKIIVRGTLCRQYFVGRGLYTFYINDNVCSMKSDVVVIFYIFFPWLVIWRVYNFFPDSNRICRRPLHLVWRVLKHDFEAEELRVWWPRQAYSTGTRNGMRFVLFYIYISWKSTHEKCSNVKTLYCQGITISKKVIRSHGEPIPSHKNSSINLKSMVLLFHRNI